MRIATGAYELNRLAVEIFDKMKTRASTVEIIKQQLRKRARQKKGGVIRIYGVHMVIYSTSRIDVVDSPTKPANIAVSKKANPIAILPRDDDNFTAEYIRSEPCYKRTYTIPQFAKYLVTVEKIAPVIDIQKVIVNIYHRIKGNYGRRIQMYGVEIFVEEDKSIKVLERKRMTTTEYILSRGIKPRYASRYRDWMSHNSKNGNEMEFMGEKIRLIKFPHATLVEVIK